MKAKRGGNVTESQLKTIFADDKAMQDLLKVDCQKDFLLNTLNKKKKEKERKREEQKQENTLKQLQDNFL
jgi:lipid A disaccharide synthetase